MAANQSIPRLSPMFTSSDAWLHSNLPESIHNAGSARRLAHLDQQLQIEAAKAKENGERVFWDQARQKYKEWTERPSP